MSRGIRLRGDSARQVVVTIDFVTGYPIAKSITELVVELLHTTHCVVLTNSRMRWFRAPSISKPQATFAISGVVVQILDVSSVWIGLAVDAIQHGGEPIKCIVTILCDCSPRISFGREIPVTVVVVTD